MKLGSSSGEVGCQSRVTSRTKPLANAVTQAVRENRLRRVTTSKSTAQQGLCSESPLYTCRWGVRDRLEQGQQNDRPRCVISRREADFGHEQQTEQRRNEVGKCVNSITMISNVSQQRGVNCVLNGILNLQAESL